MGDKDDSAPLLTPHALGFEPKKKPPQADDDEVPEPQPEPEPIYVDPFVEEIDKVRKSQSPAVRDTIDRADCFGRSWYIDEGPEQGLCQQWDCDLRGLCELVYQRAKKIELAQEKDDEPTSSSTVQRSKSPDGQYERHPYVDAGRPVDKVANAIWNLVGAPPAMPDSWNYPPARNKDQRAHARRLFIDSFGDGILVSRRTSYHQYFRDGAHWMRFWVRHAGGGWLDLSADLSKQVMKHTDLKLENMSSRARHQPHRFYPYRAYISRQRHLNRLGKVFEALGIVPQNQGEDHE